MVDSYALSGRWHECLGEVLRFQIINGSLWIDHLSERHSGWYPARLGPGNDALRLYIMHVLVGHFCVDSVLIQGPSADRYLLLPQARCRARARFRTPF